MVDLLLTILTLGAPLLLGCAVRMLVPGRKKGVVLALVLAALVIPARILLDRVIHPGDAAIRVGWGFAILYGLVTGMAGVVLAELIIGSRERRAREREWQAQSEAPPAKRDGE